MGFDDGFLPVPEIPYESDLYNDAEDAIVEILDADGYLRAEYVRNTTTGVVTHRSDGGDAGIQYIEARAITEDDFDTLFEGLTQDTMPAIFVHAFAKDEDSPDSPAGVYTIPIHILIACVQGATDITYLDNNTKRRLSEIERVCRQRAGNISGDGFWAGATSLTVGPGRIDIRTSESKGVGYLALTVTKDVENRQEAI